MKNLKEKTTINQINKKTKKNQKQNQNQKPKQDYQ